MALKMKKRESGGANWMDTYGDMVTLLLCFFVMLYSMSSISEDNWRKIVMSFNPNAVEDRREIEVGNTNGPSSDPMSEGTVPMGEMMSQEAVESALKELYETLAEYAENHDQASNMEVTMGDGYVFVSFNDAVFFDGESYNLRPDGEEVLQVMADALTVASPYIDEVRIMGHTAQARSEEANRVRRDRMLSSERAAMALAYIQERTELDPGRMVSMGFGQWRPVDTNATAEGKAHNRRVEVQITGFDVESVLGDSLEQYETMRTGEAHLVTGNEDAENAAGGESGETSTDSGESGAAASTENGAAAPAGAEGTE